MEIIIGYLLIFQSAEVKNKNKKGFTFIELLIVIAILGILASIIMVNLRSAKARGQEASAKSTARSIIASLIDCKSDDGVAILGNPAADETTLVCCTDGSCSAAAAGHENLFWPSLTSVGYTYVYGGGSLDNDSYIFQLTKTGQATITCSMTTNNCQ